MKKFYPKEKSNSQLIKSQSMKRKITRGVLYTFSTLLFLTLVLFIHIYWVYRPKVDASTEVMARIDIKQAINQTDANKITSWMVRQKGVDHVLVNPESKIVIFTFFPIKANGNQIVERFKNTFHLKSERFVPTDIELQSSCPVAGSSYSYKIYKLITKII